MKINMAPPPRSPSYKAGQVIVWTFVDFLAWYFIVNVLHASDVFAGFIILCVTTNQILSEVRNK